MLPAPTREKAVQVIFGLTEPFTAPQLHKNFPNLCINPTLYWLRKVGFVRHVGSIPGHNFVGRNGNVLTTHEGYILRVSEEWRQSKNPIATAMGAINKLTSERYAVRKARAYLKKKASRKERKTFRTTLAAIHQENARLEFIKQTEGENAMMERELAAKRRNAELRRELGL